MKRWGVGGRREPGACEEKGDGKKCEDDWVQGVWRGEQGGDRCSRDTSQSDTKQGCSRGEEEGVEREARGQVG